MSRATTNTEDSRSTGTRATLVDLSAIDLSGVIADRAEIERWIPHRHELALLDKVVWADESLTHGVARWDVRDDEFWVRGHFPKHAMLPGVLMIESGAQLACYLYNRRFDRVVPAAFLRIEDAVFRRSVEPGETLYLMCAEIKCSPRRFITAIQGVVDGKIAFEGTIHGMNMDGRQS